MKPIKTATFNKTKFGIDFDHLNGLCVPDNCQPSIHLPCGLKNTKLCLETMLHEGIHACDKNDKLTETEVEKMARDLARFLWRAGWRLK